MGGKPKGPKVLTAKEQEKKDAENMKKAIEAMWKACKNDKGGDAEKALKNGFPVDYADEDVRSIWRPRYICSVLLTRWCARSQYGHTALHRAAAFGALSVLRVLHKAGAPLETQNKAKETALDTAKGLKNELAFKLLEAFAEGASPRSTSQLCALCGSNVHCRHCHHRQNGR